MNEAYACMMHHPQGAAAFGLMAYGTIVGGVFTIAAILTLADKIFRKPISVPTFSPIPEFNDGH
jgi:hypothetical protein